MDYLIFFQNLKISGSIKENSYKKLINEFHFEFTEGGHHFEQSSHYHLQVTLLLLFFIKISTNLNLKVEDSIIDLAKKAVKILDYHQEVKFPFFLTIGDNCYNFFNVNYISDLSSLKDLTTNLFGELDKEKEIISNREFVFVNHKKHKVIFDIGNIGVKQNPGHGHADIGNILISSDGIPIIIDPGTRSYDNSEESLLLKRTSSHNCLTIEEYDQAYIWRFFRYSFLPQFVKGGIIDCSNLHMFNEISGLYFNKSIVQKRDVFIKEDIIIEDNVHGKFKGDITINLILHPDLVVTNSGNGVVIDYEGKEWEIEFVSNYKRDILIENFSIFPLYHLSIKTKKIKVCFRNIEDIFSAKTVIKSRR